MAEILIAAMQPIGHVGPLLNVAQGLVERGDRVTFLTSGKHEARIRAVGGGAPTMAGEADFEENHHSTDNPGRGET